MSIEICIKCKKECTPWFSRANGHLCQDCYENGIIECNLKEKYFSERKIVCAHKWISVKEQLPETGIRIMMCNSRNIYVGRLVSNWFATDEGYAKKITHWMPLPEPPDE